MTVALEGEDGQGFCKYQGGLGKFGIGHNAGDETERLAALRPIVPIEMLSVLFQYRSRDDRLPIKGPAAGLFADQEIRLMRGPLFVGEDYEAEREAIALSGSRRTESLWVRTKVFADDDVPVAKMLLNLASIKDSYALAPATMMVRS
jgi:hypothetical protein